MNDREDHMNHDFDIQVNLAALRHFDTRSEGDLNEAAAHLQRIASGFKLLAVARRKEAANICLDKLPLVRKR